MILRELQQAVAALHIRKGYNNSPQTLLLGAVEELGEVARALLLTGCADYVPSSPQKSVSGYVEALDIAGEIGDVITYLLGLCNRLGVEPTFHWMEDEK